jgi:succinate dehydrogenase / fumarate reductase, cytochrome b subunit
MSSTLKGNRPLSPHLQVYKLIPTMLSSIVHRITGVALYFGTVLVSWWLIAAAIGPDYFDFVQMIMGSIIGRLILFGFTWALLHHMIGGVRHLIWDTGAMFDKHTSTKMAKISIVLSVALTILVWVIGYAVR